MGRERIYASPAERQKAYRDRAVKPKPAPSPPQKIRRQPSRPKQIAEMDRKLQALLSSYEDWRDQVPESLEGTAQADKVTDTIEKLSAMIDLLADIEPPLGFGRD
jgi:hypothetical protein